LGDFAVSDAQNVDAVDGALAPVVVLPPVAPADGAPIPGSKHVFGIEVRGRRRREELLPRATHFGRSLVPCTRGWRSAHEDAVVGHRGHDRVHVMTIEGFVEALDRGKRLGRVLVAHACPLLAPSAPGRLGHARCSPGYPARGRSLICRAYRER